MNDLLAQTVRLDALASVRACRSACGRLQSLRRTPTAGPPHRPCGHAGRRHHCSRIGAMTASWKTGLLDHAIPTGPVHIGPNTYSARS